MAETLTEHTNLNINDEQLSIKVIYVSVYVEPEVENQGEVENNIEKKEISMEEKRRLFYQKRLENITKCLRYLETN